MTEKEPNSPPPSYQQAAMAPRQPSPQPPQSTAPNYQYGPTVPGSYPSQQMPLAPGSYPSQQMPAAPVSYPSQQMAAAGYPPNQPMAPGPYSNQPMMPGGYVQPQPMVAGAYPYMQGQPVVQRGFVQAQPMGMVQAQNMAYTNPTVVVAGGVGPTVVVGGATYFGPYAQQAYCPRCQTQVCTEVRYIIGGSAMLMALILFVVGFIVLVTFLICWIPFVIDACKDAEHLCPQCKQVIGMYKRMDSWDNSSRYHGNRHHRRY